MRARYWHELADGRLQCDLCPRECRLRDGQRGFCYVRAREGDEVVLTTYGRSSGFAVAPIEKKPLYHFHPRTTAFSFGTAGCNLACRFCQNWSMSTANTMDALQAEASPLDIATAASRRGCASVAYTYNDPVIFAEYAIDTAEAVHAAGLKNVAVSAGYIAGPARADFFAPMDAANIDLKGFTDEFYRTLTGARLDVVLDTLTWLVHETDVWVEITTLVIEGHNDSDAELRAECAWIARELGPEVPLHLSAFHPAHRMRDVPRTSLATLRRARAIAKDACLAHVYLGNVLDDEGSSTRCAGCGALLIARSGSQTRVVGLTDGACTTCARPLVGHF